MIASVLMSVSIEYLVARPCTVGRDREFVPWSFASYAFS